MTRVHTVVNAAAASTSWPNVACLGAGPCGRAAALALRAYALAIPEVRLSMSLTGVPPCRP
eukprot:CAMPEP_0119071760 /NCGR_PEP_ID=MMETSP1178-20130426/54043_1 /TAXON_ID=33656 /ORGANISM="unid sp, Strain CCMP2000" /LENGTH=60 /DNA_ID=CAMNT_0007053721 /DNA_START=133 /DNA_END=315 /DNA_ORIENTATION=+